MSIYQKGFEYLQEVNNLLKEVYNKRFLCRSRQKHVLFVLEVIKRCLCGEGQDSQNSLSCGSKSVTVT